MTEMTESVRVERRLGWGGLEPNKPSHAQLAALPEEATIRDFLAAGICPFCGQGPFVVPALHITKVHDIDTRELHDRAGLPFKASICDPIHAARMREIGSRPEQVERMRDLRANAQRAPRQMSRAALRNLRDLAARRGAIWGQHKSPKSSPPPPHPCVVCGEIIKGRPGTTCSDECYRRLVRSQRKGKPNPAKGRRFGPLAKDEAPTVLRQGHEHGSYYGYSHGGCRCSACREAHREHMRVQKADRHARLQRGDAPEWLVHGSSSTYTNWGCRCDPCFDAHSELMRQSRLRRRSR